LDVRLSRHGLAVRPTSFWTEQPGIWCQPVM
jgi:hypothetical protein